MCLGIYSLGYMWVYPTVCICMGAFMLDITFGAYKQNIFRTSAF